MENLEKDVNQALEATEDFTKLKNELLSKLQQEPTEEAVQQYSNRFHIDLEAAKARLQDNYKKEIESVDHKEIALRLSNAYKILSPKLMGLEFREKDREELAKKAISTANSAISKVDNAIGDAKAAAKQEVFETLKALDVGKMAIAFAELERQNEVLRRSLENIEGRLYAVEGTVPDKRSFLEKVKDNFRYFWN